MFRRSLIGKSLIASTAMISIGVLMSDVADAQPAEPGNTWNLELKDGCKVAIKLRPDLAPKMVERVKTLTKPRASTTARRSIA